jgi:calcineurin-like phosphoesterase family protein
MNKFNDIWNYVTNQEEPQIRQTLLRATLLKKGKILGEYDFLQKKLLNRRESLSKIQLRKTINLLTKNKSTPITSKISKHSLFDKFINLFKKKKYFIISDLHLDHKNIIRFCNRPFNSIEGMNKTLVFNWNKTIGKNDIVYFIGDLVCGKYSKPIDYWLNKLNGKFIFIKGNHEKPSNSIKFLQYKIIDYKGTKFYLTHDPKNVPTNWNGWAICGHHHNNRIREYPFINGHTKRINVSVELINYTPLNLDKLFSLNFQNMKYLKKIR